MDQLREVKDSRSKFLPEDGRRFHYSYLGWDTPGCLTMHSYNGCEFWDYNLLEMDCEPVPADMSCIMCHFFSLVGVLRNQLHQPRGGISQQVGPTEAPSAHRDGMGWGQRTGGVFQVFAFSWRWTYCMLLRGKAGGGAWFSCFWFPPLRRRWDALGLDNFGVGWLRSLKRGDEEGRHVGSRAMDGVCVTGYMLW